MDKNGGGETEQIFWNLYENLVILTKIERPCKIQKITGDGDGKDNVAAHG